jgi:hypothetical protein
MATRTFSLPRTTFSSRDTAERAVLRVALAQRFQFSIVRSSAGDDSVGRRLAMRCHMRSCRGRVVFEASGRTLTLNATRSVMQHTCVRALVRVQRRVLVDLVCAAGMRDAPRAAIRAYLTARGARVSDSTLARLHRGLQRSDAP